MPQQPEHQQAELQQAELQQAEPRSQPSIPQFQARIPVAPAQLNDAVSPAESAKSNGGYANDGRFASGFAQVRSKLGVVLACIAAFCIAASQLLLVQPCCIGCGLEHRVPV